VLGDGPDERVMIGEDEEVMEEEEEE